MWERSVSVGCEVLPISTDVTLRQDTERCNFSVQEKYLNIHRYAQAFNS